MGSWIETHIIKRILHNMGPLSHHLSNQVKPWGTRPSMLLIFLPCHAPYQVLVSVCAIQQQQSARLADLHRKSQLWRGIVSIALIEGRNLIPMDPNGLSDPYVKFRLGQQKYRSKVRSPSPWQTLCSEMLRLLPPGEEFCDLCVCYVCRRCQRPWVHSGGNSLIFTCTRRAEEFWRSPCGTETLGGGMISLDGQLDLHW